MEDEIVCSFSRLRKRPRPHVREDMGQIDPTDEDLDVNKQRREHQVSVPLDNMVDVEITRGIRNTHIGECSEEDDDQEDWRNLATTAIGEVWQASSKVFTKKGKGRIEALLTPEVLHELGTGIKGIMYEVEHLVTNLAEKVAETFRAKQAEDEARASAKRQKLRYKIELRKQKAEYERTSAERDRLQIEIEKGRQSVLEMLARMRTQSEENKLRMEYVANLENERDLIRAEFDEEKAKAATAFLTELEREQHKTICQICFTAPRDAVVLPCMHFQYCHRCIHTHQELSTHCPTCRGMINGVLRCNLGTR